MEGDLQVVKKWSETCRWFTTWEDPMEAGLDKIVVLTLLLGVDTSDRGLACVMST